MYDGLRDQLNFARSLLFVKFNNPEKLRAIY